MRGTRSNIRHSRIAFTLLFVGLLALLSAGTAFAQFTITASVASGAGTISPVGATAEAAGATPTFTFAPATGWQVDQIRIDGVLQPPNLDATGHKILSYTFPPVAANHTISVSFVLLYTLTIGPAGPADHQVNAAAPAKNMYIVAGTTSPAVGIYSQKYLYGDTVTVAFASVNVDYKFGEYRTGNLDNNGNPVMSTQTSVLTLAQYLSLSYPSTDVYWLVDGSPAVLNGTAIPQSVTVTMQSDGTIVTAWFVRVDIIYTEIYPMPGEPMPVYGNIFEPLDGPEAPIGVGYNSYERQGGPAVQVQYEDTMPVQTISTTPAIAVGAGDQVIVDIAPNTGTPGAILFHPKSTNDTPISVAVNGSIVGTPGVAQFGKLQIDRPGVNYELEYKYYMIRADTDGSIHRYVPDKPNTVPIAHSIPFDIVPAATAHFAVGYNYFGQLGNGLVTPATTSASDRTGLPLPSNWLRTTPPNAADGNYTSQIMPQNPATHAPDLNSAHASVGPVGLAGDYLNGYIGGDTGPGLTDTTIGYPHWFQQDGYALDYSGWTDFSRTSIPGIDLEWEWDGSSRSHVYPDDWYGFGRDHYDVVQPYHTSQCHDWQAYQIAFNSVSAGQMFSMSLDASGRLWGFGDNTYGQMGLGAGVTAPYTQQPPPPEPQVSGFQAFPDPRVVTTISDVIGVASGFYHVVALKGDGTVWTWGRNNKGQLGLGTTDDPAGGHPTAAQVPRLTNVVAVSSGDYFSFALKRDGSVWGWGDNAEGELGDGTKTSRASPVQVQGLGTALFDGHTAGILGAAASPDGKYVLTCSTDGTARLSDATTGRFIRTIASSGSNAHTGPINAVAFSPDGARIVTGSTDRTAKLWGVDGSYLATFVDTTIGTSYSHQGSVTSVAFSPDGNYVATGSVDNTAKVWSTASPTYALIATCTENTMGINGVAFSPNFPAYSRIYTAGGDKTVKIYNALTGTLMENFNGPGGIAHDNAVTSIAVLKSGSDDWVVTGSGDCTAKLWLVTSGSDLETLDETFLSLFGGVVSIGGSTPSTSGHYDTVMSVAIMQDPNTSTMYVLTGSKDHSVKRWDNSTGSWALDESYVRHTDWVNAVGFGCDSGSVGAQDENLILTASRDQTAVLGTTPVVTAVAAGSSHSLFLKEDGTVWACGYNGFGQLGQGDGAAPNYLTPVQVLDPFDPSGFLQNIAGVSAGNEHSAAVTNATDGGFVLSWGSNTYGELAQGLGTVGSPAFVTTPIQAVDDTYTPISGMQAVSAGWGYSLARGYNPSTQTAAIYAWGHNNHGQLGIDGPLVTPSDLNGDWPSATLWTSPIAPGGGWGQETADGIPPLTPLTNTNSPMTTLSARYWHSQIVGFDTFYQMTWNVDPPLPGDTGVAGVVIPDTSNSGLTAGTTSQTGVAGQTMYTFSSASGTATAEPGTIVRLLAIPRPGYSFDHWDGYAPSQTDQTSWQFVNNVDTIAPLQIRAHFTAVPRQFTLAITSNPLAPVTTGAGTYNEDTVAMLVAVSPQTVNNQNYTFDHWSGDPQIENSRLSTVYLRMDSNKAITAYFVAAAPTQYTLTVHCTPTTGGSISDITNTPASSLSNGIPYNYVQGALVLLDATPSAGYVFDHWTETDAADPDQLSSTTTENTSLTMSSSVTAKVVTATFVTSNVHYTLTTQTLLNSVTSSLGGTIVPASGGSFAINAMVTVQANANTGYAFAGWSSNVAVNSLNPTTGAVRMDQNQLIQANFTQGNLPLSVQSLPFSRVGILSTSGQQSGTTNYAVAVNGNIPIGLTAPAKVTNGGQTYYFAYWTLNGYAQAQGVTLLSFVMGPSETAVANYQQDTTAPAVVQEIPVVDSVQNPADTIIQLQVTDSQSSVNLSTVKVYVEGDLIYDGSNETTAGSVGEYDTSSLTSQAVYGYATRTGNSSDYTISFQSLKPFHYEQLVHVTVTASDMTGNVMTPFSYTFSTQMRVFGQNIKANNNTTTPNLHPSTVRDALGNLWVVWDTNNTDLWLGELPAGASAFQSSIALETAVHSRVAPTTAVSPTGRMFIIWQDNRNGHWDLFGLGAANGVAGTEFPSATVPITAKSFVWTGANQTNPSAAVDGTGKLYVVWEDASATVTNIFVSSSTDLGLTWSTPAAISPQATAQTHPWIAIDSTNNVYVVWSDARNTGSGHGLDIIGASSADGGATWSVASIVGNTHNHTGPVVATESSGTILHIAWVGDDTGDKDIYYAHTSGGLPTSPLTGTDIIDDTTGADQVAPAIAVTGSGSAADVFITWQDSRNVAPTRPVDTDIYFCEVWAGLAGTNILVNSDGTTAAQTNPCIGVDSAGQAYLAWEDNRVTGHQDIWFAGSAYANPNNTVSQTQLPGGPYTVQLTGGASVLINTLPMEASVSVSGVLNPPVRPPVPVGNCYQIGPSNLAFTVPVTITVPFDPKVYPIYPAYQAYWYDYKTGLWLNDGIGAASVNTTANTVTFTSSHFTLFSVAGLGTPGGGGVIPPPSGGGGGGGCFIATSAYEAEVPTLLRGIVEVNCTGRYVISPERLQKLNDIRELRDGLLLRVPEGRVFSAWYYAIGPYAANAIRDNEPAKAAVRTLFLNPLSAFSRMCEGEAQSK